VIRYVPLVLALALALAACGDPPSYAAYEAHTEALEAARITVSPDLGEDIEPVLAAVDDWSQHLDVPEPVIGEPRDQDWSVWLVDSLPDGSVAEARLSVSAIVLSREGLERVVDAGHARLDAVQAVTAHELGHLLAGDERHADEGVMRTGEVGSVDVTPADVRFVGGAS